MADLRGSITRDSNPEGHNQYTGGMGHNKEAIVDRLMASVYDADGKLKLGGGFTIDNRTGQDLTQGYSVGAFPNATREIDASKMSSGQLQKEVDKWCEKNKGLLSDARNRVKIGGWVDPDTSHVVLDAVRVYGAEHGQVAYKMGVMANQKAIADLAAIHRGDWDHAFIDTHGTGTPVNLPWNKAHDEALSITKIVATVKKQSMKKNHPVMIYFNADATPLEIHAAIVSHLQHKEQ